MNVTTGVPLLRATAITKSYPGVQALGGVDIDLHAGEVHALVGENGAGKSTLMNILGGSVHADSGRISIDGARAHISTPRKSQRLGVSVVHQELSVAPHLSVGENIFLGRWRHHATRSRRPHRSRIPSASVR